MTLMQNPSFLSLVDSLGGLATAFAVCSTVGRIVRSEPGIQVDDLQMTRPSFLTCKDVELAIDVLVNTQIVERFDGRLYFLPAQPNHQDSSDYLEN